MSPRSKHLGARSEPKASVVSSGPARLAQAAPVFAALGDATRLGLVARLSRRGPQSIAQLTSDAGVTRQAVTKHLDVLAGAGLVRDAWRGRERIWDLHPARLEDARGYLDEISRSWDAALGRLQALVEEKAPRRA